VGQGQGGREEVMYCKRLELEDMDKTPLQRTKTIILGTIGRVEEFLRFTTETGDDFPDGW
jgi:hypothetical protein